ncbi:flagellar protein FlhE [Uliginosibacterium paludis]|uniref:Flagellar protein FlhE n=1 Tax=Uliginosibacterium paludis TaxID=1615952 RepID=A0ABV2CQI4_9RHOO
MFLSSRALCLSVVLMPLLVGAPARATTEHAYTAEAGLVRVDRRNADFDTRLAVVGPVPAAGARITQVSYRWRYENPQPGMSVMLCQERGRCIDVTDAGERRTAAFAGSDPSRPFYFRTRVGGKGGMLPLLGHSAQIIVNWTE